MATIPITVPDAAVPKLMAALRALFPDLTGDAEGQTPLGDAAAFRAVVAHLLRAQVKHRAGQQAREEQQNAVSLAEQQAWQATEGIG